MIISHKYKFIFLAIPKTGTSSIESVLLKYNEEKVPKHTTLAELQDVYGVDMSKYFTFCFTRNPWDRLVSLYLQLKKKSGKEYDTPERRFLFDFSNKNIFEEFVKMVCANECLDIMKDEKDVVDFCGRFESLQSDFLKVCDIAGIPREHLPVLNKSIEKTHYSQYYSEYTKLLVQKHFSKDIQNFAYTWRT